MTILDYDKRQTACPICKAERLIFITDAPACRPHGKSIQYRCKECATKEAAAAGDPIHLIRHKERRHVPLAWETEKRPEKAPPPPRPRKPANVADNTASARILGV